MVMAKYCVAGLVEGCLHAEVIIVSNPVTALVSDGSFWMKEKVQKKQFSQEQHDFWFLDLLTFQPTFHCLG